MNDSVAHHFVPQHLQRHFATQPGGSLSVFEVPSARTFSTGSEVLMQRGHFHTILSSGKRLNLEPLMTEIENSVIDTYEEVVRLERLPVGEKKLNELSLLVAFQELRTAKFRSNFLRVEDQLREHVAKFGATLEDIDGYQPFDEIKLKALHLHFLYEHLEGFARIIRSFDFVLLRPPHGRYFYLGDSPVVRHNRPSDGLSSSLGFAAKGLQLHLPLSKTLLLAMWAPDIISGLREGQAETRRLHAQYTLSPGVSRRIEGTPGGREIVRQCLEAARSIETLLSRIGSGQAIQLDEKTLDFYNSTQLVHAERLVVCPNEDYELARRWFDELGPGAHMSMDNP